MKSQNYDLTTPLLGVNHHPSYCSLLDVDYLTKKKNEVQKLRRGTKI